MMDVAWQQQMGVPNLVDKDKQPYYNVLAHDGSSRYAAQGETLIFVDLIQISFRVVTDMKISSE